MKLTKPTRYITAFLLLAALCGMAQPPQQRPPRLVVGIVIDQMRWDYLYRFADRYKPDGGFARLMKEGFECKNAHYNYVPTVTAVGHASIYTGATPAIHGIVGNSWYEGLKEEKVYCADDAVFGKSPRNLQVTTITDELRMAYQFKNKVYGVSIKDRAAIFPAGHHPNGAFWFDGETGRFVTSSFYKPLPEWVEAFNRQRWPDAFLKKDWTPLYDLKTYENYPFQKEMQPFYDNPFGENESLPYKLSKYAGKDYDKVSITPWGNTLTVAFSKALIENEHLGQDASMTDFLAVSFSSPDRIGHAFGPDSIETEDQYLRLDRDLGEFISYLDKTFGKDYLLFLTADHAVSRIPEFLKQRQMPGGIFDESKLEKALNAFGRQTWGIEKPIVAMANSQLYLNRGALKAKGIALSAAIEELKGEIYNRFSEDVIFAVDNHRALVESAPDFFREKIVNGYYPTRSGDITLILKSGHLPSRKGTSHFSPYNYDTHIPLLFYGWQVPKGYTNRRVNITDIAATIAQMLNIQMPSGSMGHPIPELTK